jgi:hypothetical protein
MILCLLMTEDALPSARNRIATIPGGNGPISHPQQLAW